MCLKNKKRGFNGFSRRAREVREVTEQPGAQGLTGHDKDFFFFSQRDIGSNKRDGQNFDRLYLSNLGIFAGESAKLTGHWETRGGSQLFMQLGGMDQLP